MCFPESINFASKLSLFHDHWSPKVIAKLNENQVKLVKVQGEFVWHQHDDTDELFLVIEGELDIHFRSSKGADDIVTRTLKAGEMLVVPRGMQHRPVAQHECQLLLVEPQGVVNTGESGGPLTAPTDQWI